MTDIIQDILLYFTTFLLLWVVIKSLKGASQVRMYDSAHLSMLRFVNFLSYVNFGVALVKASILFIQDSEISPDRIFGIELLLLFCIVVCTTLGVAKVRSTLTGGKKYRSAFFYFGIAFLLVTALIVYLKFGKNAGFIF